MRAINPTTEEVLEEYEEHTDAEVEGKLAAAREAFGNWRGISFGERGELFHKVAALLRKRRSDLAKRMTLEMGKPIGAAEGEIEKCAVCCEYFAEHAEAMLAEKRVETDARNSYVRYEPLGAVLAIMPWNFPYWQFFRFAAPALMAGNVAVLKHAANVPGCARAIEALFEQAGFPSGIVNNLLLDNQRTEQLIAHLAIAAVTLTGSERAGSAVGSAAGKMIKKAVLELGGSDAFIVRSDVDVAAVARAAAAARCINTGQSCIAAKRFIVHAAIGDSFSQAFVEEMRGKKMGDPFDRENELGPLARGDLRENLDGQVRRSEESGARILTGGRAQAGRGYFYEPTVVEVEDTTVAVFEEETFGPVAAVIRAKDDDQAIELANRSRFGLGASIWTRDLEAAERMVPRIETGCVFVNGPVKSDPRLPFGGIKSSGIGRELSRHGLMEFTNLKTVWVG